MIKQCIDRFYTIHLTSHNQLNKTGFVYREIPLYKSCTCLQL